MIDDATYTRTPYNDTTTVKRNGDERENAFNIKNWMKKEKKNKREKRIISVTLISVSHFYCYFVHHHHHLMCDEPEWMNEFSFVFPLFIFHWLLFHQHHCVLYKVSKYSMPFGWSVFRSVFENLFFIVIVIIIYIVYIWWWLSSCWNHFFSNIYVWIRRTIFS